MTIPANSSFLNYDDFDSAKRMCRECSVGSVYNCVVCSDGCKASPLVVISGEAPGREELEQGRPFVGKAGKLLRDSINNLGFRRSNTLITNVIPCRPLDNKFPTDVALVKSCVSKWLEQELALLQPKVMILLGNQPLRFIMGCTGITSLRGTWLELGAIRVMPTYHPSYVIRKMHMADGEQITSEFLGDLKLAAQAVGLCSH